MDPRQLETLERERLRSLRDADLETASRLHADDYQLITPGGGALGKQEYLDLVSSDEFTYEVFEPASPVQVRAYEGVAIARYQARIVVRGADGTQLDAGLFWHTDIWEQVPGGWQAAWSHATRIRVPEPDQG